jgi:hypothetical protein
VQEESVAGAARELQKDKGRGTIKSTEWSESDGLLMFCGKIYIPKDRELRCHIGELHPLETPEAPWDMISIDTIQAP